MFCSVVDIGDPVPAKRLGALAAVLENRYVTVAFPVGAAGVV